MEKTTLNQLLSGKPTSFYASLAVVAVMIAGAGWWLLHPGYVTLFKGMPESSQADVVAALTQEQIPYRINTKDESIEVPEDKASAARVRLAEAGLPAKVVKGYELFDNADYGMSEFA